MSSTSLRSLPILRSVASEQTHTKMDQTVEFCEEKGEENHDSSHRTNSNDNIHESSGHIKKGAIDLSLGLEEVSPVKVKRGSIDLSLGLTYQEPEQNSKASVPSSLLKFGLERQISDEKSREGPLVEEGIAPELLELLQPAGASPEAWEEKIEERKRYSTSPHL